MGQGASNLDNRFQAHTNSCLVKLCINNGIETVTNSITKARKPFFFAQDFSGNF